MNKNNNDNEILNDFEYINGENMKDNTENNNKMTIKVLKTKQLRIHPANDDTLPRLTDATLNALLEDLKKNGIKQRFEVTARSIYNPETDLYEHLVLDGNNRLKLILKYGLPIYKIECILVDIPEEQESDYIYKINAERRQISTLFNIYLIGKFYRENKNSWGGDRKSSGKDFHLKPTVLKLASEKGLTEKTIRNYHNFYDKCLKLISITNTSFVFSILNNGNNTQTSVKAFAKLKDENIKEIYDKYKDEIQELSLKDILEKENKKDKSKTKSLPKKIEIIINDDTYEKIKNMTIEQYLQAKEKGEI